MTAEYGEQAGAYRDFRLKLIEGKTPRYRESAWLKSAIVEDCESLGIPKFGWELLSIYGLLVQEFDLDRKFQLALITSPDTRPVKRWDPLTQTFIGSEFNMNTRADHGLWVMFIVLEILERSCQQGQRPTPEQIKIVALAAALHDSQHPNCSHAGGEAIRRIVSTVLGDRPALKRQHSYLFEDPYLDVHCRINLRGFGSTSDEIRSFLGHEERLRFLLSTAQTTNNRYDSILGGFAESPDYRSLIPEILEVLQEQKGLGEVLSLADTTAYIVHDFLEVNGAYPVVDGQTLLKSVLESLIYNSTENNLRFSTLIEEGRAVSRLENFLGLRALFRETVTHHPFTQLHDQCLQKVIWLMFFSGLLTVRDLTAGGDRFLFDRIRLRHTELVSENFKDRYPSQLLRALEPLMQSDLEVALPPFQIPLDFLECRDHDYVHHLIGSDTLDDIPTVEAAGGERVPLTDLVAEATMAEAQRLDPLSPTAAGGFVVSPPTEIAGKDLVVGDTIISDRLDKSTISANRLNLTRDPLYRGLTVWVGLFEKDLKSAREIAKHLETVFQIEVSKWRPDIP